MPNKIKSISFLYKDKRITLKARIRGTFMVPGNKTSISKRPSYTKLTAKETISHHLIKVGDPVLTLESGEKIRVYHGGDSSYLPAMVEGILNKHDEQEVEHRSTRTANNDYSFSSPAQENFPWGDYGEDYY